MASPTKKEIRKQVNEILALAETQHTTNITQAIETLKQVDKMLHLIDGEEKLSVRNTTNSTGTLKILYLSKRGNILYEWLQEYSAAEKAYQELSKLLPREPRVFKAIGDCYRKRDLHEDAIKFYKTALTKSEQDDGASPTEEASIHNNKSISHIELKQYSEAEAALKKAISKDKENVLFLCNLGKVQEAQGKSDEANETYRKAYDLTQKGKFGSGLTKANQEYVQKTLTKIVELDNLSKKTEEQLNAALAKDSGNQKLKDALSAFKDLKNKKNQVTSDALDMEKMKEKIAAEIRAKVEAEITADLQAKIEAQIKAQNAAQFDEIRKQMESFQASIEGRVAKVEEKVVNLEEDLKSKLDDWEKKLSLKIQKLGDKEQNQVTEYFQGFMGTFSCIYITSQAINSGQLTLDSGTTEGSLLSTVASFSPFFGDALSNAISTIDDFLSSKEMITNARKMAKLATDTSQLSQKVGEAGFNICLDPKYQEKIIQTTDKDLEEVAKNLFEKIKKVAGKIADKIDTKLYGELYETAAAKLGNKDANLLIEKWLNNEVSKNTVSESFKRIILAQTNGDAPPPETKKTSEAKGRGPCCQIF